MFSNVSFCQTVSEMTSSNKEVSRKNIGELRGSPLQLLDCSNNFKKSQENVPVAAETCTTDVFRTQSNIYDGEF